MVDNFTLKQSLKQLHLAEPFLSAACSTWLWENDLTREGVPGEVLENLVEEVAEVHDNSESGESLSEVIMTVKVTLKPLHSEIENNYIMYKWRYNYSC